MNRHLSVALVFAGLVACSDKSESLSSAPSDAGFFADAEPPDQGFPDSGVVPDTGPDAGRVDRTLTEFRPLGTLPVENLVLSPMLDTFSAMGPASITGGLLPRVILPASATETPAVQIPADGGMFLFTQTHGARLLAEIWVGIPESVDNVTVLVGLIAVTSAGREVQIPLELDEGSERGIDGISWRRYASILEERLYGTAALLVQNESSGAVFAQGPVVIAITSNVATTDGPKRTAPIVRSQPVSAAWQPFARQIGEWSKRLVEDNLQLPERERDRRFEPKLRPRLSK